MGMLSDHAAVISPFKKVEEALDSVYSTEEDLFLELQLSIHVLRAVLLSTHV